MLRRLSVDGLADVAVTVTVDIEDPRGTPYGVSAFMEPAAPATAYFRIRASGGAELAPTTSRVFVVQGTRR